jgi:SPP1 gp7 family putative phage head morphogenesis protein
MSNHYTQNQNGLFLPQAKASTRKKVNPKVIEIVEGFKDRSRKDIDKWRRAIQYTQFTGQQNPRFDFYHDLVDDLLTDGHLQSQIMMRLTATTNTDFHILNRKTGKENEDLTFLFRQQWFFEVLEAFLMQIIRGFQLVEFTSFEDYNIKLNLIPQRHVTPTKGQIIPDLTLINNSIDFDNPAFDQWLLKLGKRQNLGIINNIIPAIIWKRNVAQSWAEFCERFGIPLITATTAARDNKTINDVHDMLIGVGEASVGTFPQGTDVQLHEANRTDAFRVYKEFIQLNTDEISKLLVGSTMLSDQGSNRSQTEVHERSLDNKIAASDKRNVLFMINNQLLPLLQLHGYAVSEDDVFEFKTAEQEVNLEELWTISSGLLNHGFPVEQKWLSETFNIPFDGIRTIKKEDEKKNPDLKPLAHLYPEKYPISCCEESLPTASFSTSVSQKIIQLTKELALGLLTKADVSAIIGKLIVTEALQLTAGLYSGFGKTESYTSPDNLVLQMMEYNLFDFAASKTEARSYAIAQRIIDYEKGAIKNRSTFLQEALADNEMLNTTYLKTEYDTAVATGQNSAAYVRQLKEAKEGRQRYLQYQTIGDASVRSSHRALDGKIFDILEDGAKNVYPPNGYNCRCEFVPYTGQINESNKMTWDKAEGMLANSDQSYIKAGFNINRGDLKQVFTQKQFYRDIKGLPDNINKMTYDKYGLGTWEEIKGKFAELNIDQSITQKNADELFKALPDNKKRMGFTDYLGRNLLLTKTSFNRHKKRAEYFPFVKDILAKPDEVWLTKHYKKGYQTNYIKHYANKSLLVSTTLGEGMEGVQIETWFDIDYTKPLNRRTGLLIKKGKEL